MNEYGDPRFIDYDRLDSPLSRADLILAAIVLGIFTAIVATSLNSTAGLGDLLLRGFVTAVLAIGTVASVRGAILWGSTTREAKESVEPTPLPHRAYDIDLFHTRSKAV